MNVFRESLNTLLVYPGAFKDKVCSFGIKIAQYRTGLRGYKVSYDDNNIISIYWPDLAQYQPDLNEQTLSAEKKHPLC